VNKPIPSRREMLRRAATGLGWLAAQQLLAKPHFAARAERVIFLYMPGGPSQVDLLDPKPELRKWHGQALPASATKDLKLAFIKPTARVMASPREFKRHGDSGIEVSDWLPHLARQADKMCVLRAVHTEAFNHDPGEMMMMTGHM
jgi:hypothetical protein